MQSHLDTLPQQDMIELLFRTDTQAAPRTVTVSVNETVGQVKERLKVATGIHPGQQELVCGTTVLENSTRTIKSYGIRHRSSVNVRARTRGGGGGATY